MDFDSASHMRRIRHAGVASALAAALALGTVLLTPVGVAAGSLTCDYNAAQHKVRVQMTGDNGARVKRSPLGRINVGGTWCDGATVTNTDLIEVLGDGGKQALNLSLLNGGFKPGYTDEPGTTDEIEFSVAFGAGSDKVVVEGTDGVQGLTFRRLDIALVTLHAINLNWFDDDVDDQDVFMSGVDAAAVLAGGGADYIDGRGGLDLAYNRPMTIFGAAGKDTIHGGAAADTIYGGLGPDTVRGWEGNDFIDVSDGIGGNDDVYGGTGTDTCRMDLGDSEFACQTVIKVNP